MAVKLLGTNLLQQLKHGRLNKSINYGGKTARDYLLRNRHLVSRLSTTETTMGHLPLKLWCGRVPGEHPSPAVVRLLMADRDDGDSAMAPVTTRNGGKAAAATAAC